ncbi:MAG: hypothetical protein KatS3mg032_1473 [Cyclobacteriaceae bacterium]|nr:MAG: hypothetical protein KatS3mg032_1473 [Cyclobacteriaceae bacterium]
MASMLEFFNSFTPPRLFVRYSRAMRLLPVLLFLASLYGKAQPRPWWLNLPAAPLPEKILSGRTAVIYMPGITETDLTALHQRLAQTGIDAVTYAEADRVFASDEVTSAFAAHFSQREIASLIFVVHRENLWHLTVTAFTGSPALVPGNQPAWHVADSRLAEALNALYRTALNQYRRQNWLIADVPEFTKTISLFTGNRNERFAYDLKVDGLAVEKTGEAAFDAALEEIMQAYPLKYKIVERNTPVAELRRQGLTYVLRLVYARNIVLRELLGYAVNPGENALTSVTFSNGQEQIKTLPAHAYVYKVYVRHLDFGHVYLGPKWDADTTWQQALMNFIFGMRTDMRIN